MEDPQKDLKYFSALSSLRAILDTTEGINFFTLHLQSLSAEQSIDIQDVVAQAHKNVAEELLDNIFKVHPDAFMQIQQNLRSHLHEHVRQ